MHRPQKTGFAPVFAFVLIAAGAYCTSAGALEGIKRRLEWPPSVDTRLSGRNICEPSIEIASLRFCQMLQAQDSVCQPVVFTIEIRNIHLQSLSQLAGDIESRFMHACLVAADTGTAAAFVKADHHPQLILGQAHPLACLAQLRVLQHDWRGPLLQQLHLRRIG